MNALLTLFQAFYIHPVCQTFSTLLVDMETRNPRDKTVATHNSSQQFKFPWYSSLVQ